MKHLYIIRHGQTEMNVLNILAGTTETPLTELGVQQARDAGEQAKALQIDYIISSPQSRALRTAQEIARTIDYPVDKIELSDLLKERDFGEMEGKPYVPGPKDAPGTEPYDVLEERLTRAWNYVQTIPADNVLVVLHGSSGRMLRHAALPHVPFDNEGEQVGHNLPNAEIVQLI